MSEIYDIQIFMPKWLQIAIQEIGVTEILGKTHNHKILEYHATTTLNAKSDETPWCSSFVNYCVEKAGLLGTNKANAGS